MNVFATELMRAFRNRSFLLALSIGATIACWHLADTVYFSMIDNYEYALSGVMSMPNSVFNTWIGFSIWTVQEGLYFLIIPALACIPFSASLLSDKRSGYASQVISRTTKGRYYAAKSIAVFLVGAATIAIPLIIDLYGTAMMLPSLVPDANSGRFPVSENSNWSGLFLEAPYAYVWAYIALISVASGILALAGMTSGFWLAHRFSVILTPFFTCMALGFVPPLLPNTYSSNPVALLRPDQSSGAAEPLIMFVGMIIVTAALSTLIAAKAKSDEV